MAYWLAPFADAAAVLRVIETMIERPRERRGMKRVTEAGG